MGLSAGFVSSVMKPQHIIFSITKIDRVLLCNDAAFNLVSWFPKLLLPSAQHTYLCIYLLRLLQNCIMDMRNVMDVVARFS